MSIGTRCTRLCVALFALAMCSQSFALHSYSVPKRSARKTTKHHRRSVLWNPMFRPSHESLLLQNEEINRLELPRIQDDDELAALVESQALLPIRTGTTLRIDPRLDVNRRYCRPWTRDFVEDLSQAYYRQFHDQIQVNSAVRTVKVQKKLRRHNRNAAPADGDTASSHLAGLTLDLQRRGMSKEEIRFVERYLFYLRALEIGRASCRERV